MKIGRSSGFLSKRNLLGILISGFSGYYLLSALIYKSPTAPFMQLGVLWRSLTGKNG